MSGTLPDTIVDVNMKKYFLLIVLISFLLFLSGFGLANDTYTHENEIKEGKNLVESKITCDKLNNEQLEAIGEYLMEQMHPGESHKTIHQMMGMEEETEYHRRFHINMAKMMYCGQSGMMGGGMMGMPMMTGDWSNPKGFNFNNSMMASMMNFGSWGVWGWLGLIFMILFWVLIVLGIVVLIKWLVNQLSGIKKEKSALDILKERYAKGEISKEEFEEKKKDLT